MPLKTSKLCQSLSEIMGESSPMLEYFVQYMDSMKALHLVQFWLTVESFKAQNAAQAIDKNARPSTTVKTGMGSPSDTSHCTRVSCDHTTTEESHTQCSNVSKKAATSSRHHGLKRRDTENHKYCNCGIGMHHQTPPLILKQSSRTNTLPSHDSDNRSLKEDCQYPSPRLKGSNHNMHNNTVIVASKAKDTSLLSDSLESKSQPKFHSHNMPPDVLSLSSGLKPKHLLPDVVGITADMAQDAPSAKEPSLDISSTQQPAPSLNSEAISPCVHSTTDHHESNSTNLTDALGIYSTYLALNATSPVGMKDEIRQRVEVSICPVDGVIQHTCFTEAQEFVFEIMEKRYYPTFLQSSYLCKYQLDYIASGALGLIDFLLGENALSFFVEFMEQEGASSLLQFWLTAENFYNQLSRRLEHSSTNMEADIADAMTIYDRYFSLQATAPLHMEDSIRMDVENRICDEQGPRADSYLRPQLVAFHTMNEIYFPEFIASSVYLRFLNELIQMLNKDDEFTTTGKDHSRIKTANETPALKLSHIILRKDLDDPNSLWERPAFLFRLGFVDEFGEYISEIDPIPIRSSKRDHSWTVSALMLRKHRKEEDLAMKLAKNIVREVMKSTESEHHSAFDFDTH